MNYLSAEERYQHDPLFKQLVDVMTLQIRDMQLTPTELREAAMLACIRFEMMNPRPLIFRHPEVSARAQEIMQQDQAAYRKQVGESGRSVPQYSDPAGEQ